MHPRDLAKIGFLYLHDGVWDGKHVVTEQFVRLVTTPVTKTPFGDDYGYGWWISPSQHENEFMAIGRGGQRLTVLRRYNAIVVVNGGGDFDSGDVNALLATALVAEHPLPENRSAAARLKELVEDLRGPAEVLNSVDTGKEGKTFNGTYSISANPLALSTLQLNLHATEPTLQLVFDDGRAETHPIGFGVPKVSDGGYLNSPVAIRADWQDDGSLKLEYDTIANINAYTFLIRRDSGGISLEVRERTSSTATLLRGTPVP